MNKPSISSLPVSNLAWKEIIAPGVTSESLDVLSIVVPSDMQERRIYLYLEAALSSTAAYLLDAFLTLTQQGMDVGRLPASISDFTGLSPNQSVISLLNCGGSPTGDSIAVRLATKINATSPDVVVMQPIRLNATIDQIRLSFRTVWGTTFTGYRALLACLSTRY